MAANGDGGQLRISVSLSGGASLGAYHAGVLAALTTAVQALPDDELRLDAIGGASAGALASMFAAHGLLNGLDTAELLYQAWVEQVSLEMLRGRGSDAPLGFRQLRELLPGELDVDRWSRSPHGPQDTPIGLHVSLTGLRGLRFDLETVDGRVMPAMTYADWGEFVLQPRGGVEQLLTPEGASVLDFVLASAANPAGFGPELLDRTYDRDAFASRRIEDLPGDGRLWYTDGSSISSEPIGRVLSLLDRVDDGARDARRIQLMVDPLSEIPKDSNAWTADADRPTWLESLSRTLEIMPEQVLHDDLRRVQHVNNRFQRLDDLVDTLAPHLGEGAVAALHDVFDDDALPERDADAATALREVVSRVAGLHGKSPVHLDFVSPLLVADRHDRDVPGLLAGELMSDFGGFADRRLRRSDFALGYECVLAWLPEGLSRVDAADDVIATAIDAAERHQRHRWADVEMGHAGMSDLPRSSRLQLLRLGVQTLRVIAHDVWRMIR
ncbi:MAG TPA: patatin-like phospholipase family protein [Euzebyales bacterium]